MILLSLLLLIIIFYLVFIFKEIDKINEQLTYILSIETNAEITTTSRHKIIKRHVKKCNQLIQQNKQIKIQHQQKELELHQILTSLTHDLKTPLTVASGYTQLMLKNEAKNELTIKINKSLNSVNYYLNCLTDYNLIQEKRITVINEKINFSQFLMEQLFQYYEEFEQRKIQAHIEISPNIFIMNDKIILKRVVDNLLSNLLKYTKEHVSIVLTYNEKDDVEFVCENDYNGEINDLELLLLRFQTLDDSRQNKSMGIGLHIIQELTKLVNATFHIQLVDHKFIAKITIKSASNVN